VTDNERGARPFECIDHDFDGARHACLLALRRSDQS
jgi:hypothetical protein